MDVLLEQQKQYKLLELQREQEIANTKLQYQKKMNEFTKNPIFKAFIERRKFIDFDENQKQEEELFLSRLDELGVKYSVQKDYTLFTGGMGHDYETWKIDIVSIEWPL